MSGFRWNEEALAAFEKRRQEWLARGTVRTHSLEGDKNRPAKPAKTPRPPKGKRTVLKLSERAVMKACLATLATHPLVAFAWRQNTGLAMGAGHAVRFSFVGCSDILGMLVNGRFLAVECKATGKRARLDQQAFLDNVNASGGLGLCVDDPNQLIVALAAAQPKGDQ